MGNEFNFGLEIFSGHGQGRGHGHGHHQEQVRIDPVTNRAMRIANELDSGDTVSAAEHLRRDLRMFPHREQMRLVREVDAFDRKGVGADICLGAMNQQRGLWNDIRIIPPRYYPPIARGGGPIYHPQPIPRGPIYLPHPMPFPRGGSGTQVDIFIDLNIFKGR